MHVSGAKRKLADDAKKLELVEKLLTEFLNVAELLCARFSGAWFLRQLYDKR